MADYATLLRDHITLTCRSIDRIFLQAYVPKLQSVGQVCRFLHRQRGFPIPSSAAFGQIGEAYVAEIHCWAKANDIPIRYFAKKENKEKIAEPLLRAAAEKGRRWQGGPHRDCSGESLDLALVEEEGTGASQAPPHGVGP